MACVATCSRAPSADEVRISRGVGRVSLSGSNPFGIHALFVSVGWPIGAGASWAGRRLAMSVKPLTAALSLAAFVLALYCIFFRSRCRLKPLRSGRLR
jgi:hypothetical protein